VANEPQVRDHSDAELVVLVRQGSASAYGLLYERHSGAALSLANHLARSAAEADDLVSEAFARVLDALRHGKGPDTSFRSYLLTSVRHVAYDKGRKDRRVGVAGVAGDQHEPMAGAFRKGA
jgi:DNA-directed RNA polymerase specialized sigma24 family protein